MWPRASRSGDYSAFCATGTVIRGYDPILSCGRRIPTAAPTTAAAIRPHPRETLLSAPPQATRAIVGDPSRRSAARRTRVRGYPTAEADRAGSARWRCAKQLTRRARHGWRHWRPVERVKNPVEPAASRALRDLARERSNSSPANLVRAAVAARSAMEMSQRAPAVSPSTVRRDHMRLLSHRSRRTRTSETCGQQPALSRATVHPS